MVAAGLSGTKALRLCLLAVAVLVAVARGESEHGGGGPPDHGDHEDHEGHGMPFGRHKGGEGPGGDGEDHGPPPECTSDQSEAAVTASTEYISCAGLNYGDFMSLVHADVELLQGAAKCFTTKVEEMEHDEPDENGEIEVDVDAVFEDCVNEVESSGDTKATEATAEFLQSMLGPESKVCSCLPAFVAKMPHCDMWERYYHLGMRVEELCNSVDEALLPVPVDTEASTEGSKSGLASSEEKPSTSTEVKKTELKDVKPQGAEEVMKEKPYGPCGEGEEVHPEDPTKCQPAHTEETYDAQGRDDRGPPPEGGGIMGLGMSVLGVVAVGGIIGVGGVWAWGKFQSGTRQPGVRYMATGGDNDIGTELGPFGREFP